MLYDIGTGTDRDSETEAEQDEQSVAPAVTTPVTTAVKAAVTIIVKTAVVTAGVTAVSYNSRHSICLLLFCSWFKASISPSVMLKEKISKSS
jgi:hypothetical protein